LKFKNTVNIFFEKLKSQKVPGSFCGCGALPNSARTEFKQHSLDYKIQRPELTHGIGICQRRYQVLFADAVRWRTRGAQRCSYRVQLADCGVRSTEFSALANSARTEFGCSSRLCTHRVQTAAFCPKVPGCCSQDTIPDLADHANYADALHANNKSACGQALSFAPFCPKVPGSFCGCGALPNREQKRPPFRVQSLAYGVLVQSTEFSALANSARTESVGLR
jgi:hypothetical protein